MRPTVDIEDLRGKRESKKGRGMKSLNFMPLMLPRKGSLDDTGI